MMKRRATSILFAVATGSGAATLALADAPADPEPQQPRVLASGAPACGNVWWKSTPECKRAGVMVTQVVEQIVRPLAVFEESSEPPLTLAEAARPLP